MKRVTPKGPGVKLNGKWCFNGQEEIISEEEYNANKDYLVMLEDIRETNERVIEVIVKDETIDIEALKEDIEQFVENYNKPEEQEDPGEDRVQYRQATVHRDDLGRGISVQGMTSMRPARSAFFS